MFFLPLSTTALTSYILVLPLCWEQNVLFSPFSIQLACLIWRLFSHIFIQYIIMVLTSGKKKASTKPPISVKWEKALYQCGVLRADCWFETNITDSVEKTSKFFSEPEVHVWSQHGLNMERNILFYWMRVLRLNSSTKSSLFSVTLWSDCNFFLSISNHITMTVQIYSV